MSLNLLDRQSTPSAANRPDKPFLRAPVVSLLLFLLALLPRLPGLSIFLTSDEENSIFYGGSNVIAAFLEGDLRGTYWHFYPGVTISLLDAVGLTGQYLLDLLAGRPVPPFTEYIYSDILALIVASRLPYAVLTAAAIPAIYLLARRLLSEPVALLGALFLAFDPFFVAHSRVAHGDAPVAVFMGLSALAFFVFGQEMGQQAQTEQRQDRDLSWRQWLSGLSGFRYLLLSAVFGGLAALTKAPGQFMALFIIGMSLLYTGLDWSRTRSGGGDQAGSKARPVRSVVGRWFKGLLIWGTISLAVFVLFWPSMWVDPAGTIRQMLAETFGKVNEGHLVYFFGRPTLNPGPWFYPYVVAFRTTPIVLLGTLFSLWLLLFQAASLLVRRNSLSKPVLWLWLFAVTLLLFGNLSPKKQDRYLLPLFPILDLLAAVGWLGLFHLVYNLLFTTFSKSTPQPPPTTPRTFSELTNIQRRLPLFVSTAFMLLLFFLHAIPTFTYYPYYLTYFNPLMGGPSRAAQTTLMGWGEGMEQVAAYLNTKPNADQLYVASTPAQTLLPYFEGVGENFYTNDIAFRADYVVLYLAQMQRLAPSPEIVRYFQAQSPEKTITIKGVPYAKIYPGPKLILSDIPPEATPVNTGLDNIIRLAGYQVQNPTLDSETVTVTLYWHALAPINTDYTISVRARTAGGRVLAQQDSWPVNGLLPTSQWRQGDYVADSHTLEIPPVEINDLHELEIVVYNLESGQPLGSPLTVPVVNCQLSTVNCQ